MTVFAGENVGHQLIGRFEDAKGFARQGRGAVAPRLDKAMFGGGDVVAVADAAGRRPGDLLGSMGLGLAGDAFDARIIRKLVSPALGADSMARSVKTLVSSLRSLV